MEAYSRAYLYLLHGAVRALRAETFVFSTRLTRVTRTLAVHDPERALATAMAATDDWSGGTRIGSALKEFNDRWGRRGLARGAVVVIVSDGWESGDTDGARAADGPPVAPGPSDRVGQPAVAEPRLRTARRRDGGRAAICRRVRERALAWRRSSTCSTSSPPAYVDARADALSSRSALTSGRSSTRSSSSPLAGAPSSTARPTRMLVSTATNVNVSNESSGSIASQVPADRQAQTDDRDHRRPELHPVRARRRRLATSSTAGTSAHASAERGREHGHHEDEAIADTTVDDETDERQQRGRHARARRPRNGGGASRSERWATIDDRGSPRADEQHRHGERHDVRRPHQVETIDGVRIEAAASRRWRSSARLDDEPHECRGEHDVRAERQEAQRRRRRWSAPAVRRRRRRGRWGGSRGVVPDPGRGVATIRRWRAPDDRSPWPPAFRCPHPRVAHRSSRRTPCAVRRRRPRAPVAPPCRSRRSPPLAALARRRRRVAGTGALTAATGDRGRGGTRRSNPASCGRGRRPARRRNATRWRGARLTSGRDVPTAAPPDGSVGHRPGRPPPRGVVAPRPDRRRPAPRADGGGPPPARPRQERAAAAWWASRRRYGPPLDVPRPSVPSGASVGRSFGRSRVGVVEVRAATSAAPSRYHRAPRRHDRRRRCTSRTDDEISGPDDVADGAGTAGRGVVDAGADTPPRLPRHERERQTLYMTGREDPDPVALGADRSGGRGWR